MATRVSPRATGVPRAAHPPLPLRYLAASGLIAVLAGAAVLAYMAIPRGGSREGAVASGEYVLYARFGTDADAVYETGAAVSAKPRQLYRIPHAPEYGIVPATSPDGRAFAYLALPPDTKAPTAGSPAELWVIDDALAGKARRLGGGYDLLVKPAWSPDRTSLVVRRSDGPNGPFELLANDLASGGASTLVRSADALFPIAFTREGALYYAALSPRGSDLYRIDRAAAPVLIAHLSDDLTRDWTLSPPGTSLAFLTLKPSAQRVSSTVQVLDLASGEVSIAGDPNVDSIAPAWTPDGMLSIGRAGATAGSILVGQNTLAAPPRGFDAPLAWSRSGSNVVVRSFDGASVSAPGRMSLTLLSTQGGRQTLASGEVTFIGWTYR